MRSGLLYCKRRAHIYSPTMSNPRENLSNRDLTHTCGLAYAPMWPRMHTSLEVPGTTLALVRPSFGDPGGKTEEFQGFHSALESRAERNPSLVSLQKVIQSK